MLHLLHKGWRKWWAAATTTTATDKVISSIQQRNMRPFWKRFWLVDEIDQCNKFGTYTYCRVAVYSGGGGGSSWKEGQLFSHYVPNLKDTHTHTNTHVYLPPQTINKDVLKNIELCTSTHTHTQTKAWQTQLTSCHPTQLTWWQPPTTIFCSCCSCSITQRHETWNVVTT